MTEFRNSIEAALTAMAWAGVAWWFGLPMSQAVVALGVLFYLVRIWQEVEHE